MNALRFSLPTIMEVLSLPKEFRKKTTVGGFLKTKLPAEYWTQSSASEIPVELWKEFLPAANIDEIKRMVQNENFKIYICSTGLPGAQIPFGASGLCPMLPITEETAAKLKKSEIVSRRMSGTNQTNTLYSIDEDDRWYVWSFASGNNANSYIWAKYELDVYSFNPINYMRTEQFTQKVMNNKLYEILKNDTEATQL